MKFPSPTSANAAYLGRLVSSGYKGAVSGGRLTLKDERTGSVLSHTIRNTWKPAAIGACLGVLAAGVWKRDRKPAMALRGGFVGGALGFAGGVMWNSRSVAGAAMGGAIKNVNATRDERWLKLNPINYG